MCITKACSLLFQEIVSCLLLYLHARRRWWHSTRTSQHYPKSEIRRKFQGQKNRSPITCCLVPEKSFLQKSALYKPHIIIICSLHKPVVSNDNMFYFLQLQISYVPYIFLNHIITHWYFCYLPIYYAINTFYINT